MSLFAALMLCFCVSTVKAQNQSDQNSNAITTHQYIQIPITVNCPEYGPISFVVETHVIYFILPNVNEAWKYHYNSYAEGYDENGDLWKYHDTWVGKREPQQLIRTITVQGPKGAKLEMRRLIVTKGNGEIVQDVIDPLCE